MNGVFRRTAFAVAAAAVLVLVPMAIGSSQTTAAPAGTLTSASFHSSTLGEDVAYNLYLPAGYSDSAPSAIPFFTCCMVAATRWRPGRR